MNICQFIFIEDEGETFQVKKSSYSRKIYKERKKEKKESRSIEKPMQKNNSNNSQNSNNNSQRDINTSSSTKESKNYVKEIQSESEGFSVRLLLFNFLYPQNYISLNLIYLLLLLQLEKISLDACRT